ncbi:hypothetical protein CSW25_06490 [Thermus scotoductus]|uniref:Uncharacterized protein n=1 Tax=Thermus scotoductus TaxID=37636 RepID=A0A430S798_THESC|nr:hypothetical protein CSW48_12175 [Thermus scotoductus]RTH07280.1 hypothetical protein CSW46_10335 [Thermus scotoductus]RTH09782.1 hypothetical protein CSW44_08465 [Thermus scotoductus]RTH09869.1 hypothetical protein CSW43_10520 [Thermus scotoductus]RTH16193.1 hypothetical protein CSW39_09875 [Thermus scotoductus]
MKSALFPTKLAQLLGSWAFWSALVLLTLARVVVVEDGTERRYMLLTPWEKGQVEFVNTVTGKPVLLEFHLPWAFQGFRAFTDPETEAYYTAGEYPWNQALARERRKTLAYCSEVGLALKLGSTWFRVEKGCLRLRLLWPP